MLPPPQPAFHLHHPAGAWFVGDTHLPFHSVDIGGAASLVLCPDTVVRLRSSHWRIHTNERSRMMTGRLLMDSARLLWFLGYTVLFFSSDAPHCHSMSCFFSMGGNHMPEVLLNTEWWIRAVLLRVAAHALIPSCLPLCAPSSPYTLSLV